MLTACASPTIPPIATVDGVPTHAAPATGVTPPHYILCSLDPIIGYAGTVDRAGKSITEDATNHVDTAATIGDTKTRGTILYHNAVVRAACGG